MLEGLTVVHGVLNGAGDVSLPCDARLNGAHGVVVTIFQLMLEMLVVISKRNFDLGSSMLMVSFQ